MDTIISPVLDKPYYNPNVKTLIGSDFDTNLIPSYFGVEIAQALKQANYPLRYYTDTDTEIKLLKSKVDFRNENKILEFLKKNRNIIGFIKEAIVEISHHFTEPTLVLELIKDEETGQNDYLTVFVLTELTVKEAREKLTEIKENWLYPNFPFVNGKLNIYLEYV